MINLFQLLLFGAPRETRTLTPKYWLLRPACLPIPPSGHVTTYLGGDEWNRATNLLRMKELHYRCATSPLVLHDGIEPPSPDYKTGIIPVY